MPSFDLPRRVLTLLVDPALLDREIADFSARLLLHRISHLSDELFDSGGEALTVRLITLDATGQPLSLNHDALYGIRTRQVELDELLQAASDSEASADIVVTSVTPTDQQRLLPTLICTPENAVREVEAVARALDVPWTTARKFPSLGVLYADQEPASTSLRALHSHIVRTKPQDTKLIELARSLAYNRLGNVCYTRDKLRFYYLQRLAARRAGLEDPPFAFEVGYYLSHYYLLVVGAFDQMCRIANRAFGFGLKRNDAGTRKGAFLKIAQNRLPGLHSLLTAPGFLSWFEILEAARHFVAHEGQAFSTSLLQPPKEEPSDAEIDAAIQQHGGWNELLGDLPADASGAAAGVLRHEYRLRQYRKVADDVMVIQVKDYTVLYRPLFKVPDEFRQLESFVNAYVEIITRELH